MLSERDFVIYLPVKMGGTNMFIGGKEQDLEVV